MHDLDSIAAQIEEHEHATIADVTMELILNDRKQSVEALSHIDRLGIQVDLDERVDGQHGY